MGLNMYLSKKTYVKNWKHNPPEDKISITVKRGGKKHPTIDPSKITYIQEEVGYWRKANQIHNWFVQNVQDGIDECQEAYVDPEKLRELYQVCLSIRENCKLEKGKVQNGYTFNEAGEKEYEYADGEVMTNPEFAEEILPTGAGFFFGSTGYDQWYMQDINNTIEMLEEELKKIDEPFKGCHAEYYYRSSW